MKKILMLTLEEIGTERLPIPRRSIILTSDAKTLIKPGILRAAVYKVRASLHIITVKQLLFSQQTDV